MATIPSTINEVQVEFASTVINDVHQNIIDALTLCIKQDIADGYTLERIYISSANDSHSQSPASRHNQKKAIDISRLNGIRISDGYNSTNHPEVTAFVSAIQQGFELYPLRRENFGPYFKKKEGAPWSVSGHADHIHFSVN